MCKESVHNVDKCEDDYEATLSLMSFLYVKNIDEINKRVKFDNVLYENCYDEDDMVIHSLKDNCLKCLEIVNFSPKTYKEYIDNEWDIKIEHHIKDYSAEFREEWAR